MKNSMMQYMEDAIARMRGLQQRSSSNRESLALELAAFDELQNADRPTDPRILEKLTRALQKI